MIKFDAHVFVSEANQQMGMTSFEEVEQAVSEVRVQYENLYHHPEDFNVEYPQMNTQDKLEEMYKASVMPLSVKRGKL